jgi:hypothetical protein
MNNSMAQLANLLGTGANQGSTPAAGSANDSFAALFAQTLAAQSTAQTAGLASSASGSTASTSAQTSSGSSQSSLGTDLNSLSQALASGNLSAAQLAFQSLQSDLQGVTGSTGAQETHHHHHHHGGEAAAAPTAATTTAASSTSASQTSVLDQLSAGLLSGVSSSSPLMGLLTGLV